MYELLGLAMVANVREPYSAVRLLCSQHDLVRALGLGLGLGLELGLELELGLGLGLGLELGLSRHLPHAAL